MEENYRVRIVKKPDVTDLAGEKVMIDFESGKYFILVGSANDIWDMLEEETELKDIVRSLTDIYEVEAGECRVCVLKFLKELEKIGFVALEKCN